MTHLVVHRYHAVPKLASIAHVKSATSSAIRFSYDAGTNSATVPSDLILWSGEDWDWERNLAVWRRAGREREGGARMR